MACRAVLPALILVVVAAAGCGGSGGKEAATTTSQSSAGTQGAASNVLVSGGQVGLAGVPAAALPGITVLGNGEESAPPDGALVALTVGSRSASFSSSGPSFEPVDASDLEPVVRALGRAGADGVSVDRFGGRSFSPFGRAARIDFEASRPDDVDKLLAAARDALGADGDMSVQTASVVFTRGDCEKLEQRAWKSALAEAHERATRMASLSGVELGRVLAVSEASTGSTPYSVATSGCESFEPSRSAYPTQRAVENTAEEITVAVTLQVTYAVAEQ
jgi:uncharacterized protein YggE